MRIGLVNNNYDLSAVQQKFYELYYSKSAGLGSVGKYHNFAHKFLEKPFNSKNHFETVLEIGAGSGEHFPFVRHSFEKYFHSDLREVLLPFADPRISIIKCDASNIPLENESCDRIIVTCLLHHLENPYSVLEEIKRLIKPNGVISILLPADPGMLYRFLRYISTERTLKKLSFDDGKFLHAMEHRNHFQSLIEQIKFAYRFDRVDIKSWPLHINRFWNLNSLYGIQINKLN